MEQYLSLFAVIAVFLQPHLLYHIKTPRKEKKENQKPKYFTRRKRYERLSKYRRKGNRGKNQAASKGKTAQGYGHQRIHVFY
jgi:hypothetical protein